MVGKNFPKASGLTNIKSWLGPVTEPHVIREASVMVDCMEAEEMVVEDAILVLPLLLVVLLL